MKWVYIEDVKDYVGQEVEIRGWVTTKGRAAGFGFFSSETERE